jgi:hypothetical protein
MKFPLSGQNKLTRIRIHPAFFKGGSDKNPRRVIFDDAVNRMTDITAAYAVRLFTVHSIETFLKFCLLLVIGTTNKTP